MIRIVSAIAALAIGATVVYAQNADAIKQRREAMRAIAKAGGPSFKIMKGEAPFDLVYSSGVISFARDRESWLDGLVRTLAIGGTLVIGDINRASLGMQKRRYQKSLLPLREMNAFTREEVRAALEQRGLAFEHWAGYQVTRPIPQLMHWNETRLRGALSRPLLWVNRAASALLGDKHPERFDSWVMRFRRQ